MLDIREDKLSCINNDTSKYHTELDHAILGPTNLSLDYEKKPEDNRLTKDSTFSRTKSLYDHQLFSELLMQSKRFSRLKPEAVFQFLEDGQKYTYTKKIAVERLDEKMNNKLDILHRMFKCDKYAPEPNEKLSHNIFSWSMNDFLKRRQLKDLVWIDVMQRISDNCLLVYKFKQDVKQLQEYLRIIFDGLYRCMGFKDVDINANIEQPICNAQKVLDIYKNVEEEHELNTRLFWELSQKDTFLTNIKRESQEKMMKIYMETKLMSSYILNPIELRYQLTWYTSKVIQMKYHQDSTQESRQNDIAKMLKKTKVETQVSANCMDFYYTAIESMKSQLTGMQTKYDNDVDAIEGRINFKKSRIEKLRQEWSFRIEEIQRFHEEIEILHRRQEQEAEQREWKRLEEEALALQTAKRKSKLAKEAKAKGGLKSGVATGKGLKGVKSKRPVKSNTPEKPVAPRK